MSVVLLELTNEHIALLKAVNWSKNNFIFSGDEMDVNVSPFGGDRVYDDMDVILNGMSGEEFDPFNGEEKKYSPEQTARFDKLLEELPQALDIILKTHSFELGNYVSRFHERDWKRK